MKKIYLHGKYGDGKFTLVDDDVYDKYKNVRLFVSPNGYVIFGHYCKRLHREIMNCPDGLVIDHKNHNRLDNRSSNLRICTQKENSNNRKGVKNYYYHKKTKKWTVEYKGKFCGYYNSEDDAKKQIQLLKSGQVYMRKTKTGASLPKNVYAYNRNNKSGVRYCFSQILNGTRYSKYGFKTIKEAVIYRDGFLLEKGILL